MVRPGAPGGGGQARGTLDAPAGSAAVTALPLLRVASLTKRYGDQLALAEVGFGLGAGEVVGLIGPNGAGKTTVLECLAGLLPSDAGSIHWAGQELPPARRKAALFYLPDGITPDAEQPVSGVLSFLGDAWGLPGFRLAEADYSRRAPCEVRR